MVKKAIILNMVLISFYGVVCGALKPMSSGQVITVNGKLLNNLTFVSSNSQSTSLDILAMTRLNASVQSWFDQGHPVAFSVSAQNPTGSGLQYYLQMMMSYPGGATDFAPVGTLQGNPSFEIYYNGVSTGYYFGPEVTQFSIAPTTAPFPAIDVAADVIPSEYCNNPSQACPYLIPALGSYFFEITSLSFQDAAGQNYSVGAAQVAKLNQQYQLLQQGGKISITVKNNIYVALFAGQSPFSLLPNAQLLGFPVKVYINQVLVASIGEPLQQNSSNGPILCILEK